MGSAGRIKWLDSCKGFAIILVVLGHMEMGMRSSGSFLENLGALSALERGIYSFHMPLFWMLAGYTFYLAYCKRREEKAKSFKKQLINTAYVYFLFSALQWAMQYVASDYTNTKVTVGDLLLIPIRPMSPFWFTFVLFFYYIIFYFFVRLKLPEYGKILIVAAVSALGNYFDPDIPFPVRLLLIHMLFFYLGILFARSGKMIADSNAAFIVLTVSGAALLLTQILFEVPDIPVVKDLIFPTVIALAFFNLFYKVSSLGRFRPLCYVGSRSLEIYVIHCMLTSAMRSVLVKLGADSCAVVLLAGTFVGVAAPLLWAFLIRRLKLYDLFFCPVNLFSKKQNNKNPSL